MKAKKAIQESGLTRTQLSRDSGLSEATIWAWLKGARKASSDGLQRLAAGLRARAAKLLKLAEELEGE